MKLWNISKNRFYENAWLDFSHCSEIFWKLFLAFIGLFSQILGLVHLNLWCPFYVRNFSKFWVKVSIYIWVLSQLMGWIFVLWIFNDNPRNSAYFPRPMTQESPKSPNSNYLKLTVKESTVLCPPLYLPRNTVFNHEVKPLTPR